MYLSYVHFRPLFFFEILVVTQIFTVASQKYTTHKRAKKINHRIVRWFILERLSLQTLPLRIIKHKRIWELAHKDACDDCSVAPHHR